MSGMRHDLGETECIQRERARRCSDGLLERLSHYHSEMAPPIKIEIKTEPEPVGAEVALLQERNEQLQAIIDRQREIITKISDDATFAQPRVLEIVAAVCGFYNLSRTVVTGPLRAAKVALPRQIICYLAREMTSASLPEIGRRLGGRDHTTILHGFNKIDRLLATDEILRDDIDVLRVKIEAMILARETLVKDIAA